MTRLKISYPRLFACFALGVLCFVFYIHFFSESDDDYVLQDYQVDNHMRNYILNPNPWNKSVVKAVLNSNSPLQMVVNRTVAKALESEFRILCWIAVTSDTWDRANVIKETWGRRCTKLIFIGDEDSKGIPEIISLPLPNGRNHLWAKTRDAFKYIYENHFNDADWFLKADTDTYVIMENLRYLLLKQKPDQPLYMGCQINLYVKQGYNSGGAGYVLNKISLERLVNKGYSHKKCQRGYTGDEDVSMGYCMSVIGVKPGDPTDTSKKNRFFPFEPADHVSPASPGNNKWYWESTSNAGKKDLNCCSDTWVSFHYVSPQLMWNMEFLIYHTKVYGMTTSLENVT